MNQQTLDFGPEMQLGPEAAGKGEGYGNDREMLADYFRLLAQKIALSRQMSRFGGNAGAMEHLNVMARRIETRLFQSKVRGEGRWLMRTFKKHGLRPEERMAVALVCYDEAKDGEGMGLGSILEIVCDNDRLKMISFRARLEDDAPALAAGLLEKAETHNPFSPGPALKLGSLVKANVFGIYEKEDDLKSQSQKQGLEKVESLEDFKSPKRFYEELTKYVVGQEGAKRAVSVAVYNHSLRISGKGAPAKANVLLYGPTGCGKTYLAEIVARLLNVPFFIADATQYTETGYAGMNVEEIFKGLYHAAGRDEKKAARGIIFIDEIDKIAATSQISQNPNRDISGRGVQEGLLKAMEGGDYPGRPFPAENVLFMAGGAFSDLKGACEKSSRKIGFLNGPESKGGKPYRASVADFIRYGMLPELMGRFQVIEPMAQLGTDNLEKILWASKDSPVEQYKKVFSDHGINLQWSPEAVRELAHRAFAMGTGARGLKSAMEDIMSPLMFEHFGADSDKKELVVSEATLKDVWSGS